MKNTNWKTKNRNEFYHRSANLDKRISEHFLEGDEAILPCRITDYYDVINKYSVEGFETMNPEFIAYLADMIRFIPSEYKLKLRIFGSELDENQKRCIVAALQEDSMYELGSVEEERSELRKSLLCNIAGLIFMLFFFPATSRVISGMPREFLYIFFWFFSDVIISYILYDRRMIKNKLIRAGRMASMQVEFCSSEKTVLSKGEISI